MYPSTQQEVTMNLKSPKTKQEFARYLRDVFVKLEHAHTSDYFEEMNLADLIEDVSVTACRFGAGHLIAPQHHAMKTREALVVVGRLLAWAEQNPGDYFDSRQAADYIGVTIASLYGLVERKRIVPLRGPRRTYRFTKKQLEHYLATNTQLCV
jgi:hypothetical protein